MDPSLLKKVWFIETVSKDDKTSPVTRGGGLCINPSGLILTTARLVTAGDLKPEQCSIRAKAYGDESLNCRTNTVIDVFPNFDLALIKASKSSENEVFDCMPIGESVQVRTGEDVYGYVHQDGLLFSARSGVTCYPFPSDVTLPDITDKTTLKSFGFLEANPTLVEDQPYRTVGSVAQNSDVAFLPFHDLHPKLPLVQVAGFGTEAGACGCPVFKHESGELVGILAIQKYSYHFAIPVNFLKVFVDHVCEVKKDLIDC